MSTIEITQSNFKSSVLESDKPVVVDFWATWCGPCKRLGPILDEVAEEYGDKIAVGKINVDEQRGLGAMFQVMSIPTVMIFKDGTKVDEFVGLRDKKEIVAKINAVV